MIVMMIISLISVKFVWVCFCVLFFNCIEFFFVVVLKI